MLCFTDIDFLGVCCCRRQAEEKGEGKSVPNDFLNRLQCCSLLGIRGVVMVCREREAERGRGKRERQREGETHTRTRTERGETELVIDGERDSRRAGDRERERQSEGGRETVGGREREMPFCTQVNKIKLVLY